jgi:2'-5' RNA ligase
MAWTQPDNWHMTLKFLGELEPDKVVKAREVLSGLDFAPFSIRPGLAGVFPGPKKPNVIWIGLAAGAPLTNALATQISERLEEAGFPPGRPFRPHMTIGRIKLDKGDDWRSHILNLRTIEWPPFMVNSVTLYKSTLSAKGPTYSAIETFPAKRGQP